MRKSDLVMPDEGRTLAREFGVHYYETSVLTYYGVNEVFENAIRAALISRRHQRFWMTNLKKVQRPLLQVCPFFILWEINYAKCFVLKDDFFRLGTQNKDTQRSIKSPWMILFINVANFSVFNPFDVGAGAPH